LIFRSAQNSEFKIKFINYSSAPTIHLYMNQMKLDEVMNELSVIRV
jgi:hypothetical protein